jgi:hypothetical protein
VLALQRGSVANIQAERPEKKCLGANKSVEGSQRLTSTM